MAQPKPNIHYIDRQSVPDFDFKTETQSKVYDASGVLTFPTWAENLTFERMDRYGDPVLVVQDTPETLLNSESKDAKSSPIASQKQISVTLNTLEVPYFGDLLCLAAFKNSKTSTWYQMGLRFTATRWSADRYDGQILRCNGDKCRLQTDSVYCESCWGEIEEDGQFLSLYLPKKLTVKFLTELTSDLIHDNPESKRWIGRDEKTGPTCRGCYLPIATEIVICVGNGPSGTFYSCDSKECRTKALESLLDARVKYDQNKALEASLPRVQTPPGGWPRETSFEKYGHFSLGPND